MEPATELGGGCLCGSVRYRLQAQPQGAGWCHCRNCQRNSGSPAMAFATIGMDEMVIDAGADRLRVYASSGDAERWFCGDCGTPLWVQDRENPQSRDFSLATLDRPDAVTPEFHIYWSSRIGWDQPADSLPRYLRGRNGELA